MSLAFYHDMNIERPHLSTVTGFVVWFRLWISGLGFETGFGRGEIQTQDDGSLLPPEALSAPLPAYSMNRQRRRMQRRHFPPARCHGALRHLSAAHLSPTQFTERVARLSTMGRIRTYRLRRRTQGLHWQDVARRHQALGFSLERFALEPGTKRYAVPGLSPAHIRPG